MMFSIGIRFMNGWYMAASDGSSKKTAEWPPHPDRVFMAMLAALFETEKHQDKIITQQEKDVLKWLECLDPPSIVSSSAKQRMNMSSYVPVNDYRDPKFNPINRIKQERAFPLSVPKDPTVYLVWPNTKLDEYFYDTLKKLTAKVTHVGHSASMVLMWVDNKTIHDKLTWVPSKSFPVKNLRIPTPGRFDDLVDMYKQNLRPTPAGWCGYGRYQPIRQTTKPQYSQTVFSPSIIVLAIREKNRLPLTGTLKFTRALRFCLMKCCNPVPSWISGHNPDNTVLQDNHLAFFPLSFVGHEYADGRIMGAGMALPKNLSTIDAGTYLEDFLYDRKTGVERAHKIFDGKWLECTVSLETREEPPSSLSNDSYIKPASQWSTITPIALKRYVNTKKESEIIGMIKEMCIDIGLPSPLDVLVSHTSVFEGVPRAEQFPLLNGKYGSGRYHTHATIIFEQPVIGPLLIGAGRYLGYGLCYPLRGV